MAEMNGVQENTEELLIAVNLRKLFLAGLGAAVMTQEGLTKIVKGFVASSSKLIERGEQVSDTRAQEHQVRLDAAEADVVAEQVVEIQEAAEKRLDNVWRRINIPTATDVSELNDKLETLNARLDAYSQDEEE